MDTSKEYIEMCSNATEIQESYNNKWGTDLDYGTFIVEDGVVDCIGSYTVDDRGVLNDLESFIVLPTQDQLQDMLKGSVMDKLERFYKLFCKAIILVRSSITDDIADNFKNQWGETMKEKSPLLIMASDDDCEITYLGCVRLDSMEKMWLAMVMMELYNKTWDKETKQWILKK